MNPGLSIKLWSFSEVGVTIAMGHGIFYVENLQIEHSISVCLNVTVSQTPICSKMKSSQHNRYNCGMADQAP